MGKRRALALSVTLLVGVAGCASNKTAETTANVSSTGWMPASAYVYTWGDSVPERCRNTSAMLKGCMQYRMEAMYSAYMELKRRGVLDK